MTMISLLQEIIKDAQEDQWFTGVTRHLQIKTVRNKATVVFGVRRCGKSVLLNQIVSGLLSSGVKRENILYINFFDERLAILNSEGLQTVMDAYYLIYPGKKSSEKIYCFFDEIQVIEGWELFVDRLLRTGNCEIFISGSSAKMLSKEIASQLRGRAMSWELFPFSFKEFLDLSGLSYSLPLSSRRRLTVQKAFGDYWEQGGFPEVFGLESNLRIKIHQEYFNSILYRDLIERYDISHPKALTDLARKLCDSIASMYTLNSLTGFLQATGHKVPKTTVSDYLEWFEDACFLFTVRLFDASFSRSNANPKKIYCIDHSAIKSVSSGILVNSGHLLENLVFINLRRTFENVWYYKTRNNQEIDFIVQNSDRKLRLFQICETLANPITRKRELSALQNAMNELAVDQAVLVTMNDSEEIRLQSGTVNVLPAWRFLLELDS